MDVFLSATGHKERDSKYRPIDKEMRSKSHQKETGHPFGRPILFTRFWRMSGPPINMLTPCHFLEKSPAAPLEKKKPASASTPTDTRIAISRSVRSRVQSYYSPRTHVSLDICRSQSPAYSQVVCFCIMAAKLREGPLNHRKARFWKVDSNEVSELRYSNEEQSRNRTLLPLEFG